MRRAHYLKRNKTSEIPSQFIFMDTETKGEQITPTREKHTLWFGWCCYVRFQMLDGVEVKTEDWYRFETAEQFWSWVLARVRSGSKAFCFAHNWNFDGAIVKTESILKGAGFETLQYVNEKPPFILRVKRGKQYLALIDTLNYFAMSLEALGDSIGITKLEYPAGDDSVGTWDTYCRRDVEVIRDAILTFRSFIRENDLGTFRPTLASQALTAYRHRFMHHKILIHTEEDVSELERAAYYGGRVECFHIGTVKKKLYYLDVNSLYPYVMRAHTFPNILTWTDDDPSVQSLRDALPEYAVVARVQLNTDVPAFPYRYRNKLTFPTGRFETTLATPELAYALELGAVESVSEIAAYLHTELFTEYVDTLYQLRLKWRKEGNTAFDFLTKIMMNSLYGKFGQKGAHWTELRDATESDPLEWLEQETEEDPVYKMRVRFGKVQRLTHDEEAMESFPAIAAHVTSYARMLLWELIHTAGKGHAYYTDTDSLVVDAVGFRRLRKYRDNHRLGGLKLERTATEATFYGPKDYIFGDEERHKGIRRNAKQLGPSTWEQVRFWSWDVHQKQGDEGFIYIDTVTKTLKRVYDKGVVMPDGSVEPLRFLL